MTAPRDRRWLSARGLMGGLTLFAIEALIVACLALCAVVISALVLTVL